MGVPNIKIYQLPDGYSEDGDTDLQSRVNDELVPVTPKLAKLAYVKAASPLTGVVLVSQQALIQFDKNSGKVSHPLVASGSKYATSGVAWAALLWEPYGSLAPVVKKGDGTVIDPSQYTLASDGITFTGTDVGATIEAYSKSTTGPAYALLGDTIYKGTGTNPTWNKLVIGFNGVDPIDMASMYTNGVGYVLVGGATTPVVGTYAYIKPKSKTFISPNPNWIGGHMEMWPDIFVGEYDYRHMLYEITAGGNEVPIPRTLPISGSTQRAWGDTFFPTAHAYPMDSFGNILEANAIAMAGKSNSTNDAVALTTDKTAVYYDDKGRPTTVGWTMDGTKNYTSMLSSRVDNMVYWVIDNSQHGDYRLEFEWFDLNANIYGPPFNPQAPYKGDVLVIYDGTATGALTSTDDPATGGKKYAINNSQLLTEIAAYTGTGSNVINLTNGQRVGANSQGGFTTDYIRGVPVIVIVLYSDAAGNASGFKLKSSPPYQMTWPNYDVDEINGELWVHKHSSLGTAPGAADMTVSPAFPVSAEELRIIRRQAVTRTTIDGVQPPILGQGGGPSWVHGLTNRWYPWIDEKIVEPKYDGIGVYLGQATNRPTPVKDYHMIALMRAVDYILAPVYVAQINATVDTVVPYVTPYGVVG